MMTISVVFLYTGMILKDYVTTNWFLHKRLVCYLLCKWPDTTLKWQHKISDWCQFLLLCSHTHTHTHTQIVYQSKQNYQMLLVINEWWQVMICFPCYKKKNFVPCDKIHIRKGTLTSQKRHFFVIAQRCLITKNHGVIEA